MRLWLRKWVDFVTSRDSGVCEFTHSLILTAHDVPICPAGLLPQAISLHLFIKRLSRDPQRLIDRL